MHVDIEEVACARKHMVGWRVIEMVRRYVRVEVKRAAEKNTYNRGKSYTTHTVDQLLGATEHAWWFVIPLTKPP